MTPAEQQVIDEAARLRAENERLKASLHPHDAEPGDTIVKVYPDGTMLCDSRGGQRRRVKNVGSVEMRDRVRELEAELAAAKRREAKVAADVVALREFAQAQRTGARELSEDADSEYKESGYDGEAVAYGALLVKMDELETFREVK